ncbi:hypothetical protein BJ138DRAFT_825057 [Hygrophoropsis aurantiaca]|uniref:Uncharacterized protein n=1 Tax=Hygrophoropsis aurantiaca TaxID=72124 RepID=A0ACB8AU38_9AGAM|nr:hypothetical protein BJ138DRAFT_825057 [Hygrophoropsis aurantiaca]
MLAFLSLHRLLCLRGSVWGRILLPHFSPPVSASKLSIKWVSEIGLVYQLVSIVEGFFLASTPQIQDAGEDLKTCKCSSVSISKTPN